MNKTKKIKPYTHEELGIPHMLQIAGRDIEVIFDPKMNGNAFYDTSQNIIKVFPGNKDRMPAKQRLQKAFIEEVIHWCIYLTRFHKEDLKDGEITENEHFIGIVSELMFQVQKQLKEFIDKIV
jgi:hypothetical protein